MQPQTMTTVPGRSRFRRPKWPSREKALRCGLSRTEQVLMASRSAAVGSAVRRRPSDSKAPAMTSESCSFIWQPNVSR